MFHSNVFIIGFSCCWIFFTNCVHDHTCSSPTQPPYPTPLPYPLPYPWAMLYQRYQKWLTASLPAVLSVWLPRQKRKSAIYSENNFLQNCEVEMGGKLPSSFCLNLSSHFCHGCLLLVSFLLKNKFMQFCIIFLPVPTTFPIPPPDLSFSTFCTLHSCVPTHCHLHM